MTNVVLFNREMDLSQRLKKVEREIWHLIDFIDKIEGSSSYSDELKAEKMNDILDLLKDKLLLVVCDD